MRPNTRQRSWSNYVGNRPIESRRGTEFYGDSPRYGPKDAEPEDEEDDGMVRSSVAKTLDKQNSGLRKAMTQVFLPYDPNVPS